MAFKGCVLCCFLLLLRSSFVRAIDDAFFKKTYAKYDTALLNRTSFPKGFIFGTGSASYQYEGAAYEDGKGLNIWDTYTHKHPERISDKSNGDVALDSYHRYKEDIGIMKAMGTDAHRFSISWARILPKGKLSGGVNKLGIQHYNNVINELLAQGLQPYVTLFHWDLPQTLEDEYGGFLSPRIVDDYKDYADVCFKAFGDRVKNWFTLNEPWTFSDGGYAGGTLAPGRCSAWQGLNCTGGNSATEPYVVAHNQLLAHAAAVKLYREKYQASQKGAIGITLVCHWMVPASGAKHNINAALRSLDFMLGWFLDPLVYGDYPHSMRSYVRSRLPKFTKEQSMMVKGSFDYIGINYYTAYYASYSPNSNNPPSYLTDSLATLSSVLNGVAIGIPAASSWLHSYPRGIRDLLLYVKNKYKNPIIYITENGVDEFNNATLPLEQQLADPMRIDYYYHHFQYLRQAIMEGVTVKGYFAWSLLDNFEWYSGYTVRFGINYVDYKNGLKRYPKHSALWFKRFLHKHYR